MRNSSVHPFAFFSKPFHTIVLGAFFLLLSVLTQAQTLEIEASANKTDILTGETVIYTLKYKCAGTTSNCTGVTMTSNIPSGMYIPTQSIGLTSDMASFSISGDHKTITFVFNEPLIAGHTGIIEFNATGVLGLPNNTPTTLTAQILSNGTPAASATVPVILHSYNKFCPQITGGFGLGLDNTTYYKIGLKTASSSFNGVGVTNPGPIHIEDQLPANAIIDSVVLYTDYPSQFTMPLGTVNVAGNGFTADIPAYNTSVYINGYTTEIQVKVYVRYPSASFSAGQSVTNSVTITHTPEGGSPVTLTNNVVVAYQYSDTNEYSTNYASSCTTLLDATNLLQAPLSKLKIGKTTEASLKPGEAGQYVLNISNEGNVVLDDVVVEDLLPSTVNVTTIRILNGYFANIGGGIVKYWIKTTNNATYTEVAPAYQVINAPAGAFITAFKVTIDHLPAAARTNAAIYLDYNVSPTATVGSTIQNCLTGTSSTAGVTVDDATACSNTTVITPDPFSLISMLKRFTEQFGSSIYGGVFNRGDFIYAQLNMKVYGGGQPLQKPVVMDLLPKGVDYIDFKYGSAYHAPYAVNPAPTADLVEVIPNYNGTGRTLVRLSWNNPWPVLSDYYITLKLKVNDLAVAGTHTLYSYEEVNYGNPYKELKGLKNASFFTGTGAKKCRYLNYYYQGVSIQDSLDLNGDGSKLDTLCWSTAYLGVTSVAQLESIKWVKGQCDANYSRYPDFGSTMAGGLANYRLIIKNNGNVPAKNFEIIDILPWVGDKGVIDPNPRLTEWRPNLVTPFTAPPGIVVYYSTVSNPCRTDYVAAVPAGCTAANWSTILPRDPTTIQSIKLDFGTKVLNPGDQTEITWDMRAPVSAPTNNEIAWNSFAFKAQRSDNNDAFLPAEPFKVGIKLKPNQPANYGDLVWLDTNQNGIQDAGETGIDGVRVEFYLDNGDGINNPKTDQLIAFTSTANGGLYLFPAIPVGNYYAVFFLPPGYNNSPANATADDKDSDGIAGICNGNRVVITPITTLSSNETDLTWDQGVFPDKAAVGNYVWFDENQNNIQDESAANGINGVEVCLYTSAGTLVKRDTTSNDMYGRPGYYLFDMLTPGDYYIQFKPTADKTYTPNTGTSGGASSDPTDSDADATGKTATFTLTSGQVDLSWDAGLIIPTGIYKLGNFVWNDVNNDGIANPTETGINNVTVNLYKDNNNDNKPQADEFIATTLTMTVGGSDGIYTFERLPAGNYIVQIAGQNFSNNLKDYISSTGNDPAPDPDNNIENDDNGTAVLDCGVLSKPITLGANAEPLDAGTTNYSVDFGFYKCAKPNYTASVLQPTCAGGTGSITITGTIGDKVGYTIGALHTGTYSNAVLVSSLTGGVVVNNIASAANDVTYTVRVYNGEEACYKDFTFTIPKLVCCPTAICLPVTVIRRN
jgi:uncharacterized repeat protein (TIGR01451 family)